MAHGRARDDVLVSTGIVQSLADGSTAAEEEVELVEVELLLGDEQPANNIDSVIDGLLGPVQWDEIIGELDGEEA